MTDVHRFDPALTLQTDLRGGRSPWNIGIHRPAPSAVTGSLRTEVLIVGGGITGSLVAEHLSRRHHDVCVIDRECPGLGSTAASTAMLQWEIDCSLSELTGFYGFERAANIYRRSLQAVTGLKNLVSRMGLQCDFRDRSSLYVTGGDIKAQELAAEHVLRQKAGLPGVYLDYLTLKREFGLGREAAILSPGSADTDPLCLSHALMASAAAQRARLFEAEAVSYDCTGNSVVVTLDTGHVIHASTVILATGYVMPDFVQTDLHKTASSWAIATPPQASSDLWRDGVLIWEASEPYLYARTTIDGRIVIGGEDDDTVTPCERDRLMSSKAETLLEKLSWLWPDAEASADFVWSGAFGETEDGLPLIGEVPGYPRVYAAYGYGGNGITFSYLASRLLANMIVGHREPWYDEFALDRPPPRT
jgi:glycine/D-amino acid oxidase-like deaminating enzyme